jgi:peroxiredoxin
MLRCRGGGEDHNFHYRLPGEMKWRGAQSESAAEGFATLQAELDAITAERRRLVQPERLARIDAAYAELLQQGIGAQALRAGDVAPSFELPDNAGKPVSSAEILERGPLVVVFFRGRWCPYCVTQLEAMQRWLPELKAAGASLVAISPQNQKHSYLTKEQHQLLYPVLSDAGNRVAREFGLVFQLPPALQDVYEQIFINLKVYNGTNDWTLPVPAMYVVGPDGKLTWAFSDPDYTRRAEPTDVVKAVIGGS